MTAVNTNSKEVLARLLASENLNVEHRNVQTASFDLQSRTLTLPAWDDMTNETYDHLVGHEVGHALFTPEQEWADAVRSASSRGFKSFLNVVEDARIERMIQNRFPGLRRSFIASYRKLLADGFFGGDLQKINSMKLVDRLNVYYKCGMSAGVEITRNEMRWVEAINNIQTFEDVIRVAKELYAYEKAQQEAADKAQDEDISKMKAEAGEDTEEFEDEFGGDEFGEEESDEFGADFDDELDEPAEEEMDGSGTRGAGSAGEIIAETVESLEENIKKEFSADNGISRNNVYVNWDVDNSSVIVGYKELLMEISSLHPSINNTNYKKFLSNNKKTIDYLVKEFEMRKAADNYSRAAVSATGMIDTVKMNSYKYNDDIFRKITVVPNGKSHGLLMFIDWSGSMQQCLGNTIEQMMNLVMFCRQVNIPFQVYSFTDNNNKFIDPDSRLLNTTVGEVAIDKQLNICELFSNKMRTAEFNKMMQYMSLLVSSSRWAYQHFTTSLHMGSTPLNETIVISKNLFEKFKLGNRLDIVNMVFLTDGESNRMEYTMTYGDENNTLRSGANSYGERNVVKYIDKETKKQYRFNYDRNVGYTGVSAEETRILLNMLRDNTGANVIGFRIFMNKSYEVRNTLHNIGVRNSAVVEQIFKNMRKERFVDIPGAGYSKFFGLFYQDLKVQAAELDVSLDASKSELRRAFSKANRDRLISRVFLNKFIEMIA